MAVTITYTDRGTYHRCYCTGSGTFTVADIYAQLYADAGGAETYMTRTGSPGSYVYTFILQPGENYVQLRWVGNTFAMESCRLNFQVHATWNGTWYGIYTDTSATFQMTDNSHIDMNANGSLYSYGYLRLDGDCQWVGTEGNEYIIENYRYAVSYAYSTTPWTLDWVILREFGFATGYALNFLTTALSSYGGDFMEHSFTNVTVTDTSGNGYLYFYEQLANATFDNWYVEGINILAWARCTAKFTNSTFKDIVSYPRTQGNGALQTSHYWPASTKQFGTGGNQQPMLIFDTCTFDNCDAGTYGFRAYGGPVILFKNCTWLNQTRKMYNSQSIILFYGETNWSAGVLYYHDGAAYLHVRKLALTVQDEGGSPIENASVSIRTKLTKTVNGRAHPYEEFRFLTNEDGEVKCMGYEEDIYLTEKEETSDGVYAQWSDGVSNNVHIIEVSKTGYTLDTREVAMTEDRTIVVQLATTPAGATTIYGSTIYGSTIY